MVVLVVILGKNLSSWACEHDSIVEEDLQPFDNLHVASELTQPL